MRAKLTPEQRQAILEDYRNGVKVEAIGAKFGVDCSYPIILARRRGLRLRREHSPLLAAVYRKIAEQRSYMPTHVVAGYWGVSEHHIRRIAREHGQEKQS